jgi:sulfoacetaldehyde dehydrogenase
MSNDITIDNIIKDIVTKSKSAKNQLNNKSNKFINELIVKIASNVLTKKNNLLLSSLAVKETKFGNIKDKIKKNMYKTKNLLNEIVKIKTLKPIFNNEKNIYEILKPIGVICGVTPSTNPIATSLNYIINSIKARNAIIICPNPRSYLTVLELIKIIKKILRTYKISEDLVNIAPKEILRNDLIIDLFELCDKNIVTGNKLAISRVKRSSKPFLIFGTGNVPVIVDKKNNLKETTKFIVQSKSFDNSTSCSADSVIIVDRHIYLDFIDSFKKNEVYILNNEEKKSLDKIYFKKGNINTELIAKNPNIILEKIGLKKNKNNFKLIGYEISKFDPSHYIFDEKILPLVGIIKSNGINNSIQLAQEILKVNGKGHSAGIYSQSKKNIEKFSLSIPVSRIIVNQPHSQSAGGNKNNQLNTTLSLGCGPWGGNLINDNLQLRDFCNITKIVYKHKKNPKIIKMIRSYK